MALFDSIISGAAEKFGLGDKADTLLASLLNFMTNQETGGFSGFLDKCKEAGFGDAAKSWVSSGDNAEVSNEQIASVFGDDAISSMADEAGVDKDKATSALAFMTPKVVDSLTPDGEVPDDKSILSKASGFLTGIGGAAAGVVAGAAGAAGAAASGVADKAGDVAGAAADKAGDVAGAAADKGKAVVGAAGDAAGAVSDKAGDAVKSVSGAFDGDGDGGSTLKWLLPLLLLGILLVLGLMFCSGDKEGKTAGNTNTNTNAKDNTNAGDPTDDAATDGAKELTGIVLTDDVTIDAYPGGIEEQLINFIKSDEYKNATDDDLKNKWFSFDDLNFEFNSTELTSGSTRQLNNIVEILKAYPDVKIKIGGYTDKKGNDAANKKLSQSRANAVKAALVKAGVGSQVPQAEGYGEEFAEVDENASDEEREKDRKTAVRLVKTDGDKPAGDDAAKPKDKPAGDDAAKPKDKPAGDDAAKPKDKPAGDDAAKPKDKPASNDLAEPKDKPDTDGAAKQEDKPADDAANKE